MRFKPGESGNLKGRPLGSKNKITNDLRTRISIFLNAEFSTFCTAFRGLTPEKKLKFYTDLLSFSVPKLSNTKLDVEFEALSDEQLDLIIEKLKKTANEQKRQN